MIMCLELKEEAMIITDNNREVGLGIETMKEEVDIRNVIIEITIVEITAEAVEEIGEDDKILYLINLTNDYYLNVCLLIIYQ